MPRLCIKPPSFCLLLLWAMFALLALSACDLAPQSNPGGTQQLSVSYKTEAGGASSSGVVDSPLSVSVRMPDMASAADSAMSSVTLMFLNEAGRPANFGGRPAEPMPMRPTMDTTTWEYVGSVPSSPGKYHAQVTWQKLYGTQETQTVNIREPELLAQAETAPPLVSGYTFAYEANLWMLSTDMARERRLTYFPPFYEYADNATWSPDGERIAFTYSPRAAADQLPSTEIWTVKPGGSDPARLVAHQASESLLDPAWSPDGKYIYFTVDAQPADPSLPEEQHIDRVELATGVRSQWSPNAEMPDISADGHYIVFIEALPTDPEAATPHQRLVLAQADGSSRRVLVSESQYQLMYAPSMSPDNKWVVFAAINVPPPPPGAAFDLLGWLGLEPEVAVAHGLPWDLYMVSTSGGTPIQLTSLNEDQPQAIWLDNSTLAFMGFTGLYKLNIDDKGSPKVAPLKLHEGSQHGGLSWHAP